MPVAQMVDLRCNLEPQQLQSLDHARPTDTEHDILAESRIPIATTHMRGDPTVVFTVARQIGAQQVEANPTNLRQPYARHHGAAGERHTDLERHAFSCE